MACRTGGRLAASGHLGLAVAHCSRRPRASRRDGGRQESLELHEGRTARPGRPWPPGEGLYTVPRSREACNRRLYGSGHVYRVPRRRHGRNHDGRQYGRLSGVAAVRTAVVHRAVYRQRQPCCVRHHEPVATTGRRRLRPIRHGTIEQ